MQLRIVTDQPWQVTADVLAVPIVGQPSFGGGLAELNRRSGGELAALASFGELTGKRYHAALASSGDLPAGRLLAVGAGEGDALTRETIQRLGATIERRLGGRTVHSLAIWLGDLGTHLDGGDTTVAELLVRGVVEGSYEPKAIYLATVESAPPTLDELILVAPGADTPALTRAANRGRIMGEGANVARTLANRASNDVSPIVLADAARDIAARNGLALDVVEPAQAVEIDIGGTGYFRKASPFAARGANGVTHATLVELALAGAR